jgi:poly-gamma-glutamate synthesis protein (capsule biosynthesis protein)
MKYILILLISALGPSAWAQDTYFALTGDSIINRRQSVVSDPANVELFNRIRKADVAFTNFETLIHDFEPAPAAENGGVPMRSPLWITDELKALGFDIVSTANNHSVDYGAEGLLSTIKHLDAAGLIHSGTGENLAHAQAPGYLDTARGRVALVSATSTFPSFGLAGEQRRDLKGRPGVNPLRFTTTYGVSKQTLDGLRQLQGRGDSNGPLRFLGATFVESAEPSVSRKANQGDVEALLGSIREARRQADWVFVSYHGHENGGNRSLPADFQAEFAHAAIDAGADIFVGHGPHVLRGIEIYKGKPILHGVGNFFFENESVEFLPTESYNQLDLPASSHPGEFYDRRSRNDTAGFPADRDIWESILAEVRFDSERKLVDIRIVPVELGFGRPRTHRGRPGLAEGETAKRILETVRKLSEPYGAKLEINGDEGRIVPNR